MPSLHAYANNIIIIHYLAVLNNVNHAPPVASNQDSGCHKNHIECFFVSRFPFLRKVVEIFKFLRKLSSNPADRGKTELSKT